MRFASFLFPGFLMVALGLAGCASTAETAPPETTTPDDVAYAEVDLETVEFDERYEPMLQFLEASGLYLVQVREVVSPSASRSEAQYEVSVRADTDRLHTVTFLIYPSEEEARIERVPVSTQRAVPIGGAGIGSTRSGTVYRSGAVVAVAPGGRASLVHRRLNQIFGSPVAS